MANTDTQTVARLLREYAQRSSLRGGKPYRSKAYFKAADSLGALSQPLDRIIAAGTLTDILGIGDAIADIITKLYQTGSHPSLEKLRKEVPEGVLELFAIPGIRPDKILKLHRELGITSVAELEAAAKEDRIRKTRSLGASLQTDENPSESFEKRSSSAQSFRTSEHAVATVNNSTRNIASKSRVTSAGEASL